MRKAVLTGAALLAIALSSSVALAITETQAIVIPVLENLKLKPIQSKVIGGPQKFRVTKETLDLLKKTMDDGKVIVLDSQGKITFEKERPRDGE